MLSPVLITPPATLPLTLAEAKAYARVETDAEDDLVLDLIRGAVSRLDGWTGLLGRALEEQTWEIGLDIAPALPLPVGPVASIVGVYFTDPTGIEVTVDPDQYRLERNGVEAWLVPDFGLPAGAGALRVRWVAGVGCPAALKDVIRRMVRHEYDHREAMDDDVLASQIAPWRRQRI